MTIREALKEAGARLTAAGVPDAPVDARLLLAEALGLEPLQALANPDRKLKESETLRFFRWLAQRETREPLQYILGKAPFMGHIFETAPGVLIPRQDSETLCQLAIRLAKENGRVLDLCCGSGCLGISLKLARPDCHVSLGDVSEDALALSQRNAQRLGAELILARGDFLAPFEGQRFDLILCNPPYIPSHQLAGLQEEVKREPTLALDGGADGLRFYRQIMRQAADFLNPNGVLLLELGDHQADMVSALCPSGFKPPRVHKDLAGLPRVLETGLDGGVD